MSDGAGGATAQATSLDPAGGVTLDRYAGVLAGLAEGLLLSDVLGNEGVDPEVWPEAEDVWQERLAEDEDGALQARFDAVLADAQTRYGRPVKPMDDDVDVWIDFVRRFAAADAPLVFTAALGMKPSDVLRLHRHWARRMADDPQVAAAAQAAIEREPRELPPLVLGERSIRPREGDPPIVPRLERALAVEVEVEVEVDALGEGDEAPPFFELPPSLDEVSRGGVGERALPAPGVVAPPPAFSLAVAPLPPPDRLVRRTEAPAPPAPEAASPLPFAPKLDDVPAAPRPPSGLAPPRIPLDGTISTSELPPDLLRRLAEAQLPFIKKADALGPPPQDEPATLAPQPSPFVRPALPFAPIASEPARSAAPRVSDGALPFALVAPVAPPAAQRPPSPQATTAPLPSLTLEQYASMCAELAVFSDRQEAVFAKYGLADLPRRHAFDAAWKDRLKRYPSERTEWERRYWQYEASWRRARR